MNPERMMQRFYQTPESGGSGGEGGGKKVEFTPEQQDHINQTVEARLRKARQEWEKRSAGGSPEEREELERLRAAQKKREEEEAIKKGEYERLVQSAKDETARKQQAWEKERGELLGDLKRDRCDGTIISAAAKFGAYNPAQVAKLLNDRVILDDARQVVVLGEDGKPAYKAGNPLTPEELVRSFLDDNPHLVKASNPQGGSGAKGGKTNAGDGGSAHLTDVDKIKAEIADLEESIRKGGMPKDADSVKLLQLKRKLAAAEKASKAA